MQRIALFAATSGHSGVDRILRHLAQQFAAWGIAVDVLQIREHGPVIDPATIPKLRLIDLGARHVATALPGLVRYLRRERPAALLSDKDRVNRLAVVARRLSGVQLRLTLRIGTTVSVNLAARRRLDRTLQRLSMRYIYPHADAIVVPSQGVANDLVTVAQLNPARIQVVPSPIVTPELYTEIAQPPPHPWLAAGMPPVVLGVGELSERKDFATLIRAVARCQPCRLILLGRGRQATALRQLAADLGIASSVDCPGFVANPWCWMRHAALFVLSSRWEGLPVALIEALACGTPVVATNCPSGPAEVLTDPRCGTLVPVGDVSAMATAITHWLHSDKPTPAFCDPLIARYGIEQSAAAYLRALGLVDWIPH